MHLLAGFGFGSVFVIIDHLLRVHPFVASSYLNPSEGDFEYDALLLEGVDGASLAAGENATAQIAEQPETADRVAEIVKLDRRRAFVVYNDPQLGSHVIIATKSYGASSSERVGKNKVTAIAVREQGNEKFKKVLRFI